MAASPNDSILLTEYKRYVAAIRPSKELNVDELLSLIKDVKNKFGIEQLVIAPSTEFLNRFLIDNRNPFESIGCTIPIVAKELYEKISDKLSFSRLCQAHGIAIPGEISIHDVAQLPVVAKPKRYFSSTGEVLIPMIISDQNELEQFTLKWQEDDFYIQQYIAGESYYLLYYFHRNGMIYKFSQQNIAQQPGGKSIVAAVSSDIHQSQISTPFENLFRSLNYFGFVMVEIKRMQNQYYMIEANPRFWGPSQLFVDAGINFFEAFLHDMGVTDTSAPQFMYRDQPIRYFWFGGMMETLRNHRQLTYYGSSQSSILQELSVWIKSDVYNRPDSEAIFLKELSN